MTRWDRDGTGWDEVQGLRLDCGIALLTTGAQQSRANCNEVGPWFLGSTEDWGLTSSVVGVLMEVPFGPWPLQKGTFQARTRRWQDGGAYRTARRWCTVLRCSRARVACKVQRSPMSLFRRTRLARDAVWLRVCGEEEA